MLGSLSSWNRSLERYQAFAVPLQIFWTMLLSQASTSEGVKAEAVASSLPGLVLLQIQEDDQEVLASASFLDEMEALEAEYERGF